MSQAKFIEDFLSAADFQNPVEVSMGAQLEDLPEWDSLAVPGVIIIFGTEYGKIITGEDLIEARMVDDLYQMPGL